MHRARQLRKPIFWSECLKEMRDARCTNCSHVEAKQSVPAVADASRASLGRSWVFFGFS